MDQAVLAPIDVDALAQNDFLLWTHTLFIPSYFALLSILILFAQAIYSSSPVRRLRGEDVQVATTRDDPGIAASATRTGFLSAVKDHVEKSGGSTIFLFQVSRFLVVLTLLGLEIFIFIQEEGQQHLSPSSAVNALSKNWSKKQKGKHRNGGSSLTERGWLDLMLCLTYLYAAFLALVTVTARTVRASVTLFHLSSLLPGTFSVYA
ncbi:hypothetical protein BJY52DRAFT_1225808 [Lactarius psammicola]|nr:hypothetical protein BJY52DRAFT_1225808 [Lactarius psammicola]